MRTRFTITSRLSVRPSSFQGAPVTTALAPLSARCEVPLVRCRFEAEAAEDVEARLEGAARRTARGSGSLRVEMPYFLAKSASVSLRHAQARRHSERE